MYKNIKCSKACILANQFRKYTNMTASEAMSEAWAIVRSHGEELHVLRATKKDGTVTSRVVYTDWSKFNEVKGTGRKTPDHIRLFVDAAKHHVGMRSTVSFYRENITQLAA